MNEYFVLSGFVVGVLVGFTGVGGGSLMTALLISVFGVHPVAAVGTDLLFAAATKSVGTRVHAGKGNVVWRVVSLLALGSIPGTLVVIFVLAQLPVHDPAVTRWLRHAISVALLISGASLLLGSRALPTEPGDEVRSSAFTAPLTVLLGFVLGVLVSLTSVGAGAIGMVALCYLYPRASSVRLVGSDIAHAVPLTLLAGSGHWLIGDIDWPMLFALLTGSVPGIIIGSHFAHRVAERYLRMILGVGLLAIGASLIVK
ncbi:MAG: sulfite exporter TauE/SafE family protein [Hyphomicrobium sp.]